MKSTWISFPPVLASFWVLELHHQHLYHSICSPHSAHIGPQLSIREAVCCIDILQQHDWTPFLQSQLVHVLRGTHLSHIVNEGFELRLQVVTVPGFEHLFIPFQLCKLPVIDCLGSLLCAHYGGGYLSVYPVSPLEHPRPEQPHVLVCLAVSPESQQQVSIGLVTRL